MFEGKKDLLADYDSGGGGSGKVSITCPHLFRNQCMGTELPYIPAQGHKNPRNRASPSPHSMLCLPDVLITLLANVGSFCHVMRSSS